jgi:hypothetical protein
MGHARYLTTVRRCSWWAHACTILMNITLVLFFINSIKFKKKIDQVNLFRTNQQFILRKSILLIATYVRKQHHVWGKSESIYLE